ncbi:c-type cytochrome [Jiella sonneratiae]|uniref:C-type cytochrome n=1 Tax=Jiella sonneratiae TaxID=2816856 RepID=A0ABS3J325_9HYPH|nr:c-type cytochrome [Jiella sonneratiae]MBO0903383.1 c-type cytochrome [Jiella sonneratiae]
MRGNLAATAMHGLRTALAFCLLAPGIVHAGPRGDPAEGRRLAERWCANCHIVSPEQRAGTADVLTFEAIARKTTDFDALAAFLADPHPVMADIGLTQREIADLVAYIASLR